MHQHKIKAFTLVELIIVITILAILATIAFVSFQNYVKDSRDTTRLATLKNIESGLQVFQVNTGNYPEPDNKVNIYASGVLIGYQGSVGENIAKMIKIDAIPQDPFDGAKYPLVVNILKNKYQIGGYMESSIKYALSLAYASDYTTRIFQVFGNQLGVILNPDNSIISGTGIDIVTTQYTYKVVLNNSVNGSIVGTGNILAFVRDGGGKSCKEILQNDITKKGNNKYYYINPTGTGSFEVYCDMSYVGEEDELGGEGWFLNGTGISTENGSNAINTIELLKNPGSNYSLHQTGTGIAEYEIHLKDISKCKKGYNIYMRAWVSDTMGSIFHYRTLFTDGVDSRPTPIGKILLTQFIGGKTWELQEVIAPITKDLADYSWFIGYLTEIPKDLYVSGIKLYCGPEPK